MNSAEQTAGVIASIFWGPSSTEQNAARIAKFVSLASITGFIWLEFSVFAALTSAILNIDSKVVDISVFFVVCFLVFYIVIRYGLRGFVFADLFQTPIILLGSVVLLAGMIASIVFYETPGRSDVRAIAWGDVLQPVLPPHDLVIFALHVTLSNFAYVVLSELHWIRVWLFESRDAIRLQRISIASTSAIWFLLALVGLGASFFSDRPGVEGIADILHTGLLANPAFHLAFWLAGCAALFSTADALVYGFLLVNSYNPASGALAGRTLRSTRRSTPYSIITAGAATMVYALVRITNVPFEKIVFVLAPILINILPALIDAITRSRVRAWPLATSIVLYTVCSILGFLQPANQLTFTLTAALVPCAIAAALFLTRP